MTNLSVENVGIAGFELVRSDSMLCLNVSYCGDKEVMLDHFDIPVVSDSIAHYILLG